MCTLNLLSFLRLLCFTYNIFLADHLIFQITALSPILLCLSKAFEVCMRSQMVEYLMLNKLLDPLQSGFKANYSTETALLKVVDDLSRAADLKCGSVLSLLDFSKAFNSIDHELLPIKLSNYFNFSSSAISMIRAYLTG
jgi:hypothetical protein